MRRTGYVTLVILSLAVAAYALGVYIALPAGAAVHPDMRATFQAHDRLFLLAHVFGSAFALVLGPFQFASRLRSGRPALHRWLGRLYLAVGVLIGGAAGLLLAFNASGGGIAQLGFGGLAVAWLASGVMAWRAIRAGDVPTHRRWMVRNFALTFAAVTLRLWLPGMVASGVPFATAYPVVAWLCWVPNLLVAEWFFNRARPRMSPPQGTAQNA